MVVPPHLVHVMNRLAQNMYINAPTLSQLAACEAFDCGDELTNHVKKYQNSRAAVLEVLDELGLGHCISPADGAFYVYVDLATRGITKREGGLMDSPSLCKRLLEEAHVAITPGLDFEDPESGRGFERVRISYSRDTSEVKEGMKRIKQWWLKNIPKKG